jgi:hypothetical protein
MVHAKTRTDILATVTNTNWLLESKSAWAERSVRWRQREREREMKEIRVAEMRGPSAWDMATSSIGRTTSTPCPLMLAGIDHRSIDVTGVGFVVTFLEEWKAAMECRKAGITDDGQLDATMKQAKRLARMCPGFQKWRWGFILPGTPGMVNPVPISQTLFLVLPYSPDLSPYLKLILPKTLGNSLSDHFLTPFPEAGANQNLACAYRFAPPLPQAVEE